MDEKDWQKVLRDIKARFKAEGKVPSSKKPMSVTGNDGFISYPAAEDQIKITKERIWQGKEYQPKISEYNPVLKERHWNPHFCRLCWRLFLPKYKGQLYHHNVCGAFVEEKKNRKGVLNAVEFLPAKTLREIGGTVLLPRAYVILFLIAAVEIRLRYRMVRTTTIRLWYKLRGKQQEVYNP